MTKQVHENDCSEPLDDSHATCPLVDLTEPDPEEIAQASLANAIDDLVTAGRNVAKDRNCGTVRKLKRAAIDYVLAATDMLPDEDRIPENLIEQLREYEELDGDD